jgi:hypothetical protein
MGLQNPDSLVQDALWGNILNSRGLQNPMNLVQDDSYGKILNRMEKFSSR